MFGRARRVPRVAPVVTALAAIALIGATCGVAQAPPSGGARAAASVAAAPAPAPRETAQSRVPAPAATTAPSPAPPAATATPASEPTADADAAPSATPAPTVDAAIATPPPSSARSTFDPAGLAVMGPVGFVSLDDPAMIPAGHATWLRPDDIVLGVVHPSGEAHAFPIKQMAYHHIANTTVAGKPYLVTY